MSPDWKRFQEELDRRGKGLQWLAEQLKCSIQRVQNWTTRGVPRGAFPEIAAAFGESIDWAAGLVPPKAQQAAASPPMDEDAKALLAQYAQLTPEQRQALRQMAEIAKLVPPGPTPPQLKRKDYLGSETDWGDLDNTGE